MSAANARDSDPVKDRAAELDQMTDRDAIISLEREFRGWLVYKCADRLCHARHHQDEAHIRGEDWTDLRDMIIREVGS